MTLLNSKCQSNVLNSVLNTLANAKNIQRITQFRDALPAFEMTRPVTGLVTGLALLLSGPQFASAGSSSGSGNGIRHAVDAPAVLAVEAASTVEDTVTAVSKLLKVHRFKIILVVNHMAAADSVGLDLRPTQVIYAQPPAAVDAKLRRNSSTVFIDLPLKFLIFQDENGEVQIRYNTVGYLVDRHNIPTREWSLQAIEHVNSLLGRPDNGLVTIASSLPVTEAYAAIKAALIANGAFRIPLERSFGRGSNLQKLIVFGNPLAGTPLMQADQNIALDLPQEILVASDGQGGSLITYNDPVFIANRYNIVGQEARLAAISNALASFAAAGSQ